MSEVTRILSAIERGDPHAASQLLPLVYDELRRLAAQKLAQEKPGQTLQATALVHEAYLRLVGGEQFANRRHFFAGAAQAMRRILVESARRKQLAPRVDLGDFEHVAHAADERLLELHDALERLDGEEPMAARVVEARVLAGLSVEGPPRRWASPPPPPSATGSTPAPGRTASSAAAERRAGGHFFLSC
jgi:RNA polymerase sigma factor (TIGR02999 family)